MEEARAGKRASMQGLTTEVREELVAVRGDRVKKKERVLSGDECIELWRSWPCAGT